MTEVLIALWSLLALILAGWILAKLGVAPPGSDTAITKICFALPLPAMVFHAVSTAHISQVFSPALLVNFLSAVILYVLFYALGVWVFKLRDGEQTIAALCASYTNAGNIGIPYLIAIVGDPTLGAAIMLFQLGILMPFSFFLLGRQTAPGSRPATASPSSPAQFPVEVPALASSRGGVLRRFWQGFRVVLFQPPLWGMALGLLWSATGIPLWPVLEEPVEMLAAAVVPMLMLAVGINASRSSLRDLRQGWGALSSVLFFKLILSPLVVYLLCLALGVGGPLRLASMVAATFPVANNVFAFAMKFNAGVELARNAMVLSALLSFPVVTAVALVFR